MSPLELNPEQREAATHLEGRLVVAAGAGSGKTRVLTERVGNALVPGVVQGWTPLNIDDVLAITFTEKAAGELSERVRATLRRAGLQEQAQRVDAGWISTIHALCARILRTSALDAGLDPGFAVLQGVEVNRCRQTAFERAARALLDDRSVVRLFDTYGYASLAQSVCRFADHLRTSRIHVDELRVASTRVPVLELGMNARIFFRDVIEDLDRCGIESEPVALHRSACDATLRRLAELTQHSNDADFAETLFRVLSAHEIPAKYKGIAEIRDRIRCGRAELCSQAASVVLADLARGFSRLAVTYQDEFAAEKRKRSGLDFDDLQVEAVRLLQTEAASAAWTNRFRLAMVDEFQDTDGLQLELVGRLAGDKLCTVGDEQQSIYRFRGADVETYRRHREEMAAAGGHSVQLHTNYRSHPKILAFVNTVFGSPHLFGDSLLELRPGRDEPEPPLIPDTEPRIEIIASPKNGSSGRAARRALAVEVARAVSMLHHERGVPLGDIVVLLRAYRHADDYSRALSEAGLDCVVVGGSRFFARQETTAMRALTRLIANTRDETALGSVLRSELVDMSDDGLLALRAAVMEGSATTLWYALETAVLLPADRARADVLRRAVELARARAGRETLVSVLLRAIEDLGYDATLLSGGQRGGERYANVLKFVRLASEYERDGGRGAKGFTTFLDAKEAFRDHEAPASLVQEGGQAIRIMSIHMSKGLEFPVVVVPELGEQGPQESGSILWRLGSSPALGLALPSAWGADGSRSTELYDEIKEQSRVEEEAELKRLMYVAFTRARDVLVLAGAYDKSGSGHKMLGYLLSALGITFCSETDEVVHGADGTPLYRARHIEPVTEQQEVEGAGDSVGPSDDEVVAWLGAVAAPPTALTPSRMPVPRHFSYTSLSEYAECPRRYECKRLLKMGTELSTRGGASSFGSAFHTLLERLGSHGVLDRSIVDAVASTYALEPTERPRLLDAAENYMRSSLAERVRRAARTSFEAPFSVRLGDDDGWFVLSGNIDVLAVSSVGDTLLVDYKTGTDDASIAELERRYRLQAECYALAAARAGRVGVEVVFVRPEVREADEPQQVSFRFDQDDMRDIEAELIALYKRIASGEFEPVERWSEDMCPQCRVSSALCSIKSAGRPASGAS